MKGSKQGPPGGLCRLSVQVAPERRSGMPASSKTQSDMSDQSAVRLEPWGEGDLALLKKLMGDPEMTRHLGGPESDEQITARHANFLRLTEEGSARVCKIVLQATSEAVGSVVYWEHPWRGEQIYEIGWEVLPAFQGLGIASAATREAIVMARSDGKHRFLHAFPSVDNLPSNAICRKLGFTLIEECEFEYPKGSFMQCNDWRLDLSVGN
ncbi:MAG TPA: GNAT family N-acetyltransferase [Ktedonobacteraceae bacterium]